MAAGDPHSRIHRIGSVPVLIARGAGFGQGSESERWNAVLEFLLKYQQPIESGQAHPALRGEAGAGLSHQPLGARDRIMKIKLLLPPLPENASKYSEMAVNATKNIEKIILDYSPESLKKVDDIIIKFYNEKVSPENIGATLFAFGCYVGEVFIRNNKGIWRKEEETKMKGMASFFIVVELPDGKICNPIGKVFKRAESGESEGIFYFYQVFALNKN